MKKKLALLYTALCVTLILIMTMFSGCYRNRMLEYYGNDDNYIKYSGTLEKTRRYDDVSYIYFKDVYVDSEKVMNYDDLEIIKDNYLILLDNGFYDEVNLGDVVEFIQAPSLWGDGYIVPVAAIWCNGKCYLDFETGKANILKYVEETEKF